MTDNVESGQPEGQAQETPAPTPEETGVQQTSQTQDGVVSRAEFEALQKQLRGLQSVGDKNASTLGEIVEHVGQLNLTPVQQEQLEKLQSQDRINKLEAMVQKLAGVEPEPQEPVSQEPQSVEEVIRQEVAKALQGQPSGASAVTPSGGGAPSASSIEELVAQKEALLSSREGVTTREGRKQLAEISAQMAQLED